MFLYDIEAFVLDSSFHQSRLVVHIRVPDRCKKMFSGIPDKVFRDFHLFWIFPSCSRGCKTTSCKTSGVNLDILTSFCGKSIDANVLDRSQTEHFLLDSAVILA